LTHPRTHQERAVPLVPFAEANNVGDQFLALLQKYGIDPPARTSMEGELLSLTELVEVTKNPSLAQGGDQALILRTAAGIHDLASKLLSVAKLPEFVNFIPHLRLISEQKAHKTSLLQNAASGFDDDTSRKMAELYVACLAAHVGTNVQLDHPTKAKGDNPDVMFGAETTTNVKKQWAIAIKTIASEHGQTIYERIEEACNQIDSPRCQADVGIVLINAKNALRHDTLWNPPTPFRDCAHAQGALHGQLSRLIESAMHNRSQSDWDALFQRKVVRPVLFMGQSLVSIPTSVSARTPTTLKMLMMFEAGGVPDPAASGLAAALNAYMQTVLLGVPGGPGQGPG
jgi:hypothetical protein